MKVGRTLILQDFNLVLPVDTGLYSQSVAMVVYDDKHIYSNNILQHYPGKSGGIIQKNYTFSNNDNLLAVIHSEPDHSLEPLYLVQYGMYQGESYNNPAGTAR